MTFKFLLKKQITKNLKKKGGKGSEAKGQI